MPERLAKRILLVGWDAADWKVITPLLDAGQLPCLERVINQGVMGNLTTLAPILSPMLWTSIATGKRADKHGILGFIEPDPRSGKFRPIASTSRRVRSRADLGLRRVRSGGVPKLRLLESYSEEIMARGGFVEGSQFRSLSSSPSCGN
jgi:hypothetical protein